jgi:hypothetical protein
MPENAFGCKYYTYSTEAGISAKVHAMRQTVYADPRRQFYVQSRYTRH